MKDLLTPRRRRRRAPAVAAVAAFAAFAAAAPSAEAFFTVGKCGGAAVTGRGASFQQFAQQGFSAGFSGSGACPGHPTISYEPQGSGAGRNAFGATGGARAVGIHFFGTDEGPSVAQQAAMNAGVAGTTDDATVHIIPVAAGAVASTVNYPNVSPTTACPIPTGYLQPGSVAGENRLRVSNYRLERAWAGVYATWGEFLADPDGPGGLEGLADAVPNGPACAARPLVRVVRQDSSGTTFAFKDFLSRIESPGATPDGPVNGSAWRTDTTFGLGSNNANRSWPNTRGNGAEATPVLGLPVGTPGPTTCDPNYAGTPTGNPVCRPGPNGNTNANGGGPQMDLLVAAGTDGAIGYADLANALARNLQKSNDANDDKYWIPVQQRLTSTYVEPTANADGYRSARATGGANCSNVAVTDIPVAADPTVASGWFDTTMAYPAAGYGACSLTYMGAWDDNALVYLSLAGNGGAALEERRARAVKDYLDYIVSDAGQGTLVAQEYSPLPANALAAARTGVAAIGWDKKNAAPTPPPPPGPPPPPPPPDATPPPPPPPPAPSNVFSITSARAQGTTAIALSLRLPGAGSVQAVAKGTYKIRKGGRTRTVKVNVGSTKVSVSKSGTLTVKIKLSSATRSALRRAKMAVSIRVTFTPTGGTAASKTRALTLKKTKAKRKTTR